MNKADKLIIYSGLTFGILLQWVAIHRIDIETREFLGFLVLIVFAVIFIFLVGKINEQNR